MTISKAKEMFMEHKKIDQYFDHYVNELQHWEKNKELSDWYDEFAIFCSKLGELSKDK